MLSEPLGLLDRLEPPEPPDLLDQLVPKICLLDSSDAYTDFSYEPRVLAVLLDLPGQLGQLVLKICLPKESSGLY